MNTQFRNHTCPVCMGTGRVPVPQEHERYKTMLAGYDRNTETLRCGNCGGQYMMGVATGKVGLDRDGVPCTHDYEVRQIAACLTEHTCKRCGDRYQIDSGD